MSDKLKINFKNLFNIFLLLIISLAGGIFGCCYLSICDIPLINKYIRSFQLILIIFMSVITVLYIIFKTLKKQFLYKTIIIFTLILTITFISLYFLQTSGFFNRVDSVEDLRIFIESFGGYAEAIFIAIQFLQVAILPIPGFITIGAGVLLFGPLKGAILSSVGIILGSLVAFLIGKIFGYKVACWLVGKDDLDKWMNKIKGKDKIILTFMFLFPFFPDDILCVVAGLTTIDWKFFIIMTVIVRTFSVFTVTYSLNGSIIPYNTWWGILIWAIIFITCIFIAFIIYNKGDKIQKFIKTAFKRKNN